MIGLFRKKVKETSIDYSLIKADMHSHLLPGIDDGSPDIETSLQYIRSLHSLGYSTLITTPHILWDLHKNTPDIIRQKEEEVNEALIKNNISINFRAAAEYFLDEHVSGLLDKKQPLLTIKDNMVLVEFSTMHLFNSMKEILFDVQMAGYQPILAHPERYVYLHKKWDFFEEVRQNGVYFQLNLLSVTGGYGSRVKEMAEYFLDNGYYSLVGTDLHHEGHLEKLKTLRIPAKLNELIQSDRLLNPQL